MATATTATPAYAAPLRKGGSNLRPESVISFLTRNEPKQRGQSGACSSFAESRGSSAKANEQGDRCLYRVSDHLPTPDEVRQWVRETEPHR